MSAFGQVTVNWLKTGRLYVPGFPVAFMGSMAQTTTSLGALHSGQGHCKADPVIGSLRSKERDFHWRIRKTGQHRGFPWCVVLFPL